MADLSREVFLREDQPALCAEWQEQQWRLFHQKLDGIGKGGMVTGAAIRFVAKAVNHELPPEPHASEADDTPKRKASRSPSRPKRGAKKMHEPVSDILHLGQDAAPLSLHVPPLPATPAIDHYLTEIRRKFDILLTSKHRQSVSAFVEVLYRDVVFTEGPAEGG